MKNIRNGYGLSNEEYSSLLNKLYGFEEYYYYKQDKHYKDYLFVINELDKIKRNVSMNPSYKNAIIGWYIFFRNTKRLLLSGQLCFQITNFCQLKCKHCYQQQNTNKIYKHMTFDEFVYLFYKHKNIVQKFIHYEYSPLRCVDIEGGEATLNPELCKIIQFLNSQDISVSLATNGINISDELIHILKYHNRNKVHISIDGFEETHNFIRGDNTFIKSISSLKKLYDSKIDVRANMTLHNLNISEYLNLKTYIESTVGCSLGSILYTPQSSQHSLNFISKDELEFYIKYKNIPEYNTNCNRSLMCYVGLTSIIQQDGGFLSCGRGYDVPITNYFTDDEEIILEKIKKYILRWRSVPVYCFDCKKVNSCLGGMLCHNCITDEGYIFNQEDRICHLLNRKERGDMYKIWQ